MTKDAPFDPCRQWLGIDAVDLGNARIVLGVSPQEADPLVVLRAADARLNLLRTISPGPFEMARTGLIKRVEEAREKLLAEIAAAPPPRPRAPADSAVTFAMPTPPSRTANAADIPPSMRQGVVPGVPPAVPSAVPPVPPTVPGGGLEKIAIRTTVYRKKTPVAGIALALLALSAVAGALIYYSAYGKLRNGKHVAVKTDGRPPARVKPAADPDGPKPKKPRRGDTDDEGPIDPTSDRAVSTSRPPSAGKERDRDSQPKPAPKKEPMREEEAAAVPPPKPMRKPGAGTAAEEKPAEEKPDEMKAVVKKPPSEKPAGNPPAEEMADEESPLDDTLAEALEALRRQEYDTVTRLLAMAAEQARGDDDERVAGWKLLAVYYKGFLEYREKALAAVKPGDEYDVKNQKVGVVEVDDEKFIYRVAGGNKTVSRDKIPAGIVLAIVMQWFDANPANDLYIGAYHLAKPESDPQRAREHWEQALAAGADASGLLPLLDDPVFSRSE